MTVTSIEVSTYMRAFLTVHMHNFITKRSVSLYTQYLIMTGAFLDVCFPKHCLTVATRQHLFVTLAFF